MRRVRRVISKSKEVDETYIAVGGIELDELLMGRYLRAEPLRRLRGGDRRQIPVLTAAIEKIRYNVT